MNLDEQPFILKGSMKAVLRSVYDGSIVAEVENKNVIVTAGRAWVLKHIVGTAVFNGNETAPLNYLAIGTSTTAPATSDTTLGSETTRKAIQNFTTSNLTSNPPSYQLECSFATNEGNTTLGEVALLNSSAAGTLLAHATFGTINKTTSNTLGISYTISG
jgi:hypothetical protein